MSELLTAVQMGAIERAAIESGEVSGLELMERAGRGVVEAIIGEWPELAGGKRRAVVLCGPGNNGGDGFVVARLLRNSGWEVTVFLYGDAGTLPPDAKANCEKWRKIGEIGKLDPAAVQRCEADLWLDAFFGTGLSRAVPEPVHRALGAAGERCAAGAGRLVAVDLPSWICSDSGRVLGGAEFPPCALTVSFHRLKLGHVLADGPLACGRAVVADIGLTGGVEGAVELVGFDPHAGRVFGKRAAHKYGHGHALILAGGPGHGGAARMAARGALRIGAGLVTLGCPPAALQENAGALDAVMVRALRGGEGLAEALVDRRINALCIGPGLGVDRAAEMLAVALGGGGVEPRPTVLDADALTAMAGDPGLLGRVHEKCVLTPHAGEFARLFPDIAEKLNAPADRGPAFSKVDATREAAARAGCVVLFKGADTVIADSQGRCSINAAHYERSAPWLATAGSGDVLAGFVAGLLARGFAPMDAAEAAAWLHVECALEFGPGLIAEDLPDTLPTVFRRLGV